MSVNHKNEKEFQADLKKFTEIFYAKQRETQHKHDYFYHPYNQQKNNNHLFKMMRRYLPDCNDYIKYEQQRSFWSELAEKLIQQSSTKI